MFKGAKVRIFTKALAIIDRPTMTPNICPTNQSDRYVAAPCGGSEVTHRAHSEVPF
ncbi:MAG: hypothetical protein DHS20C11_24360 [Lysobacteraceae bacterium]|nr:MAG: hypothetical protein DHS20C11_24360 [Xanthomonadaceae bacterium]